MNRYYYTLDFIAFCIFQDLVLEDENYFNTESSSYLSWLNNFLKIEESYDKTFSKQDKFMPDDYQKIYNIGEFQYVLELVNLYRDKYLLEEFSHMEVKNYLLCFFNYKKKSQVAFISYFQQLFNYLSKQCNQYKEIALNEIKACENFNNNDRMGEFENFLQKKYFESLSKFPYQIIDDFSGYNTIQIDIQKNINHYLSKIDNRFKPTYYKNIDESVFNLFVFRKLSKFSHRNKNKDDFDELEYHRSQNNDLVVYLLNQQFTDAEIDNILHFFDGNGYLKNKTITLPHTKTDRFRVLYLLKIFDFYKTKKNVLFDSESSFNVFVSYKIIDELDKNAFLKYYKNIRNKSSKHFLLKNMEKSHNYIREILQVDLKKLKN